MGEIDSPVKNFEKLWKEFADRYANFDLKEIDWQAVYKEYRQKVNGETTNRELFEICCSMLQELKDGHVSIDPDFRESEMQCGPPYEFTLDLEFGTTEEMRQFESTIELELARNRFSLPVRKELSEDTNFQYRVSDSYGYLRLDEMTEKLTFGKFKGAVDESVKAFKSKKGLIIDLRFNGGGWDHNAYQLAGRFVPEGNRIGHYERRRKKGTNEFTRLKYRSVKPGGRTQFVKPIVLLTSDFTASAAEVFVLLMNELPNVVIIGDHTEGIFSDMYEFRLPNKWTVSLSHQQYFSQEKENYEGMGIPPDIRVVNRSSDVADETDPVLQKAVFYLDGVTNH